MLSIVCHSPLMVVLYMLDSLNRSTHLMLTNLADRLKTSKRIRNVVRVRLASFPVLTSYLLIRYLLPAATQSPVRFCWSYNKSLLMNILIAMIWMVESLDLFEIRK